MRGKKALSSPGRGRTDNLTDDAPFFPTSQFVQALLPAPLAYFPAGQAVQAVAPAAEIFPASQLVQAEAPAAEYVPAAQGAVTAESPEIAQ